MNLTLAKTEGITDIETLNKVLDKAVNLKNILKNNERVPKVAEYVASSERFAVILKEEPKFNVLISAVLV